MRLIPAPHKKHPITETEKKIDELIQECRRVRCKQPDDGFLSWNSGIAGMTDVGQGSKDPCNMIKSPGASLLTPKTTLRLGCWNVQTLYQIGKTANVTREFRNYNLDILGLSEVRWTGAGTILNFISRMALF